ncbi:hypothetical protein DI487_15460 [Flavobacterium sediminis]|uniref:Uncharacterized protein n=1 Tax=Flavobacterium sediminis TaxID=2201181 RepID=A0A2U8QYH2_9FLAO|nr:hypothetical protein [Flavobacterium sediminis]AWM15111.1 hypothetical protein DI487_15460 [Flavobacterium sediminis]
MNYHKLILLLFYISSFTSCNNFKKNHKDELSSTQIDSLEYSVFNQTLSTISERILFNQYHAYHDGKELDFFYERFLEIKDTISLFDRIKNENIDTSKTRLSRIDFLNFADSLTSYKKLKEKDFLINKINHPKSIILISENDEILNNINPIKKVTLSRVFFSDDFKKAEYRIEVIRGNWDVISYVIKCEFKNGSWYIFEQKVVAIS